MANYLIHESNMERLEKKLATIQKKCAQSHCTFQYEVTGEEFHTYTDESTGAEYTAKFYNIAVEGTAKYNGWRFVATLDHHEEGNVIRAFDTELVVPEKYKTCGPTCEHCNKIRSRKDTYLVYNDETAEFKQVGKSCLKEFTNGLSAEDVAFFVSIYTQVEDSHDYSGPSFNRYIDVDAITRYAFECYKHWGYQKSRYSLEEEIPAGYRSTSERVTDYYYVKREHGKRREVLEAEMEAVGFNPDSESTVKDAEAALEWIRNISEDELRGNEYLRNLHVIASDSYTDWRSLGILVSLTTAYNRHIGQLAAYEKKQKEKEAEKIASGYIGEVGERITVNCKTFACISAWDNQFGTTYLYKFTDENDNVLIWYASKSVEDEEDVVAITGTVKDHSEFNGTKQTVLTRCKAAFGFKEKKAEEPALYNNEAEKAVEDFLNFVNA